MFDSEATSMDSKRLFLEIAALLLFVALGEAKDECTSNPCENGATCMDGSYGYYTCFCPSGWHGKNCEIKLSTSYRICSSGNVYNYTGGKIGVRTSSGATEDNECFYLIRIHGAETINITFQQCSLDGEGDGVYFGYGDQIPANGHFDKELCPGESHWSFNGSAAWIHVKMITNISAGYHFTISADGNDCTKKPCYNDGSCHDRLRDFHCDCQFGYGGKQCDDFTFTSIGAVIAYISAFLAVVCIYAVVWLLQRRRRNQLAYQRPSSVIPRRIISTVTQPSQGSCQPGRICSHQHDPICSCQLDHIRSRQPDVVSSHLYDTIFPVHPQPGAIRSRVPPQSPGPSPIGHQSRREMDTGPFGASNRQSLALAIFHYCPEQIDDLTFYLIAESMNPDTDVYSLGRFLELPEPEIQRYKASNYQRPEVTSSGTQRMLKDWQSKTHQINRWEHLYNALKRAHFTRGMDILVERSHEVMQITSVV